MEDDHQQDNLSIFLLHISYVCHKNSEIKGAAHGQKAQIIHVCLYDFDEPLGTMEHHQLAHPINQAAHRASLTFRARIERHKYSTHYVHIHKGGQDHCDSCNKVVCSIMVEVATGLARWQVMI